MAYRLLENIILKRWKAKNLLVAVSDATDARSASKETFKHKDTLKKAGFKWNTDINSWVVDENRFEDVKSIINGINNNKMISMVEDLLDFIDTKVKDTSNEKDVLSNKIKAYLDKMINDIENKDAQEQYKKYIAFKSKFHRYSDRNTLLIYMECPTATYVASYSNWQSKFNRQVKKGAKGIAIFVPILSNKNLNNGDIDDVDNSSESEINQKSRKVFLYKIGYVFDIADTEHIEGKPKIEVSDFNWRGSNQTSDATEKILDRLSKFIEDYGVKVEFNSTKRGEDGWTDGEKISINKLASGERKFKVLVHEFAHYILHYDNSLFSELTSELIEHLKTNRIPFSLQVIEENQADGITYMVMSHFGFETKYNVGYLINWKADKDLILLNEKILSTGAKFIINGIEK